MAILKALSIKEPYASMIANGEKFIEVRSRNTTHRGKIIICASKNPESKISGHAFALADIIDSRPMIESDKNGSGGFYDPNKYSWVLSNVRKFKPFPISGKQGIFYIDSTSKQVVSKPQ